MFWFTLCFLCVLAVGYFVYESHMQNEREERIEKNELKKERRDAIVDVVKDVINKDNK